MTESNHLYVLPGVNRGAAFANVISNLIDQHQAKEDAYLNQVWGQVADQDPSTQKRFFDTLSPDLQQKLLGKGVGVGFRPLTPVEEAANARAKWQLNAANRELNPPTAQPTPSTAQGPNGDATMTQLSAGYGPYRGLVSQAPPTSAVPTYDRMSGLTWLSGHQPTKTESLLSAAQSFGGSEGAKSAALTMTGERPTGYQSGMLADNGRFTDARVLNLSDEAAQRGRRADAYVGNLSNEGTNRDTRTDIYSNNVDSQIDARGQSARSPYNDALKKIDDLLKLADTADMRAAASKDQGVAEQIRQAANTFRQRANVIRGKLPDFASQSGLRASAPTPAPTAAPPKYDPAGLFDDGDQER